MLFIHFNQIRKTGIHNLLIQVQTMKWIANIPPDKKRSGTQVFLPACRFLLGFGLFGLFGFWFFGWFVYYQYLLALHGVR